MTSIYKFKIIQKSGFPLFLQGGRVVFHLLFVQRIPELQDQRQQEKANGGNQRGNKMMWELATPIEIQLDSITLQALLNENNIWCDTNGDTEVKFLLTVGKKIS